MYEVSTGVRCTRNEDGGIVLDIDQGQMYRLNPAGALILELLCQRCSEAEIAKKISLEYNLNEEMAVADVREFLHSLEEHDLVHSQSRRKSS